LKRVKADNRRFLNKARKLKEIHLETIEKLIKNLQSKRYIVADIREELLKKCPDIGLISSHTNRR
jgi:hypothetical protein